MKRQRVIGTTEEAARSAEEHLGRKLPPSFRAWLLENNGLNISGVHIYPIRDERDLRKTWESIVCNFENSWAEWLDTFHNDRKIFTNLLPFADYGTGDYYCFDYSQPADEGEFVIVRWRHEDGHTEPRAHSFTEFVERVLSGEFDED